jgi:hypothetical protein
MKTLVEDSLYCLCGRDEITKFLIDMELKHGEMKIEVPWPDDYISRDDESVVYHVDIEEWGIGFNIKETLEDNIHHKLTRNNRKRSSELKKGVKIIIDTIIKHYAPLILAKKAVIVKSIIQIAKSEFGLDSEIATDLLKLGFKDD